VFLQFAQFSDGLIADTMDQVIAAGIQASLGYIRAALMLAVLIASIMLMYGKLDLWETLRRGVKTGVILALLQVGTYNAQVRELFWTTLPNLAATSVGGAATNRTQAQRYNQLWQVEEAVISAADQQVTGWGPSAWRASFSLAFAEGCGKLFLVWCFALTILARIATALLICAGPFLLIAALFETTRHWVMSWVGKLVGLAIWVLFANILSELVLQGTMQYAGTVAANNAAGIFGALDGCWRLALWLFLCALTMTTLPYYSSIASGAAAGIGVANGILLGTTARAAGAVAGGVGNAAASGARAGAAAARGALRGANRVLRGARP
jgi:type IV secretory pathway VirB6-like protein